MLAEFIQKISDLAVAAKAPKIVPIPQEPAHVYGLVNAETGELQIQTAEPAPRDHQVCRLEEFARAIVHASDGKPEDAPAGWSLWYDRYGVVLLLDDATRRDRVSMPLELSEPLVSLQSLEKKSVVFSQKDLIWQLRTTWGRYLVDTSVVNSLRTLRWEFMKEDSGDLQKGKASLGSRIEGKVSGAKELPDSFMLQVPIFVQNIGAPPARINVVLEPDVQKSVFNLAVAFGECEIAIGSAECWIGDRLRLLVPDQKERIFFGTP